MRFELDNRTGLMKPTENKGIYFGKSMSGGLRVDDKFTNRTYIIERDGTIKFLFGEKRVNVYDIRNARIIADRVVRMFGRSHKYSDYKLFMRGGRVIESFEDFKERIDESLWKSGIERSKSDIQRKEDKIITNVNQLEGVDLIPTLPFVFADIDLEFNGSSDIQPEDYDKHKEEIEKLGWRLPTIDDFEKVRSYGNNLLYIEDNFIKHRKDKRNGLPVESGYYVMKVGVDGEFGCITKHGIIDTDIELVDCILTLDATRRVNRRPKLHIRLVKDKPINEGLWKSGIERSKTGVVRKEDEITTPNNLKELKEVDLDPELPFVFADKELELDGVTAIQVMKFLEVEDKIEKSGWRLPTCDELLNIRLNSEQYTLYIKNNKEVIVTNKLTNNQLIFCENDIYACVNSGQKIGYLPGSLLCNKYKLSEFNISKSHYVYVRLVKDKK